MGTIKQNRLRITWWVMRLTAYVFLGFYFTFDATNYPGSQADLIGISLLLIGILDTVWLFKKISQ